MSFCFNPAAYADGIADLLNVDSPCELGPGSPDRGAESKLQQLDRELAFESAVVDSAMADCCLSGLWLLHNFLDESHTISQDIHTSTGSYWHGIMHRREPDFPNSKYWFRKVGDHPVYSALSAVVGELARSSKPNAASSYLADQTGWDPYRFVDLCEAAIDGRTSSQLAREVAHLEWQMLFDYCYQSAVSG